MTHPVLVLGLGNPLLEDDGTGLVLLERLQRSRAWPDAVEFVDGGTWGLSLLPLISDAERMLVLDAVRTGAEPGTVVCGHDDALPRMYSRPVSPHQVDLREVLAAATLLDVVPARMAVVGIEPQCTEGLRIGLTPVVTAALDKATTHACELLAAWCGDVTQPA